MRSRSTSDALAQYRAKRDFSATPEPAPDRAPRRAKARASRARALEFVVQKHDATRLHYDVRIEVDGVMMSWAVPKGPSLDPSVKRLAVETEDHPMAYNRFEGRIPDGHYGAGDVLVWDRGTYETVPPGQERAMRAKGHLHVRFHGEKLEGEWHFVKTRSGDGPKSQWLMFKGKDEHADPAVDLVAARPESVVSGKSATRGPKRDEPARPKAPPRGRARGPAALLAKVSPPMRAISAHEIGDPTGYAYEVKLDGYRLLAALGDGRVRLVTRKGNDWTARFAPVTGAMERLDAREAVLDGEACILDDTGVSSFQKLQGWLGGDARAGTLVFAAFDLLWLDGEDLRELPLEDRRDRLAALLGKKPPAPLVFSPSLEGTPAAIEARARRAGLEGLIAKRKGSTYASGGSGSWWKLKFRRQQEVAIAGYVPRSDAADEVGALVIAVASGPGNFEVAGKVGTGFDRKTRKQLFRMLERERSDEPAVAGASRAKGVRWVRVKHVAEIELAEWTKDGAARAPSFLGLREDKSPGDCVREREVPVARAGGTKASSRVRARAIAPRAAASSSPGVTNPDKVLFPKDGITKADVAAYYASVAPFMLPHLAGRPIAVQRWPEGIDGQAWFQQHAPAKVPSFVRVVDVGGDAAGKGRLVVDNAETLGWLANLAALTLHQWSSHVPPHAADAVKCLDQPDYTVIDLDPGDGPWEHLLRVADVLRGLLEELELESLVKTSGQRGLHVLVPFRRGPSHADAMELGRKIAAAVARALPEIATVERMKAKRRGRLYVDYLQNGRGKTIVAPYSIRAKDGAPVSTPLAWSEVTRKLDPSAFTLKTVPSRLERHGDLLAPLLTATQAFPRVR